LKYRREMERAIQTWKFIVKPEARSKLGKKKSSLTLSETHHPFDEPMVLPVGDILDLHAFQPEDIASAVKEFLTYACGQEFCKRVSFTGRAPAFNARSSDLFSISILL